MDDIRVLPARHKLDVYDYHRMGETGILGEDDRVELIDGEVIDMAPIGQDHIASVNGLTRALVLAFGEKAIVSVQNPPRIDLLNEPRPDAVVFRPRDDFYRGAPFPGPEAVLLVAEVADSSLRYDRRVKLPLYARAGIPEVWIVDPRRRVVEVHRMPIGDGYTAVGKHGPEETVVLSQAPDIAVPLRLVLG